MSCYTLVAYTHRYDCHTGRYTELLNNFDEVIWSGCGDDLVAGLLGAMGVPFIVKEKKWRP